MNWAQFIGDEDLKFANKEVDQLVRYLRQHPEVSDVLFTGGDPMVMKAKVLERYIRPILEDPELEHIRTIRIGTKSVATLLVPMRMVRMCSNSGSSKMGRMYRSRTLAFITIGSPPVNSTSLTSGCCRKYRTS